MQVRRRNTLFPLFLALAALLSPVASGQTNHVFYASQSPGGNQPSNLLRIDFNGSQATVTDLGQVVVQSYPPATALEGLAESPDGTLRGLMSLNGSNPYSVVRFDNVPPVPQATAACVGSIEGYSLNTSSLAPWTVPGQFVTPASGFMYIFTDLPICSFPYGIPPPPDPLGGSIRGLARFPSGGNSLFAVTDDKVWSLQYNPGTGQFSVSPSTPLLDFGDGTFGPMFVESLTAVCGDSLYGVNNAKQPPELVRISPTGQSITGVFPLTGSATVTRVGALSYSGGGDCNTNGVPDTCDLESGTAQDCNENGLLDSCDISQGSAADCNANGIPDTCDIDSGVAQDCNDNGQPDTCDIAQGAPDANGNGIPDECEKQASVTILPGCGLNPAGSLVATGVPAIGTQMVLSVHNPLGTQNVGSAPFLWISLKPALPIGSCGLPLLGTGMAGGAGELLISLKPQHLVLMLTGPLWAGVPAPIVVSIPSNPALVGLELTAQAVLVDSIGPVTIGLTQGAKLCIGL